MTLAMTSHFDPVATAVSRSSDWEKGETFRAFLGTAEDNIDLWTKGYERARVPDDLVARIEAVPGEWKWLVLSEDWCGDASNTVPPLAAFAEAVGNVELRMLDRDQNLELMDEHLTNGTARSIPIVIVLDSDGVERGWWGPRPSDLQAWFTSAESQAMEKDDRYRELRKWYARDHGRTTIEEVVAIVERAAGVGGIG
ncbi:thioredoxin family protein [Rubrivirga sp.]|uniref:thioredoxin family protein n=1 Tax=Rubrivirga sp. TaxID=1885344 RepID=UPI003C71BDAE